MSQDLWVKRAATFFGVGYFPYGPGTLASLGALALAWLVGDWTSLLLIPATLIGIMISPKAGELFDSFDPEVFVLDEVCGMWLALVGIPHTAVALIAAFALFRFFDIAKPWPISRIQKMRSPIGIVADDLAAGLAANIVLRIFIH